MEEVAVCPRSEFHRAEKFYKAIGRVTQTSLVPVDPQELRLHRVAIVRQDVLSGDPSSDLLTQHDHYSRLGALLDSRGNNAAFLLPHPREASHDLEGDSFVCERDMLISSVLHGRTVPCTAAHATATLEPEVDEQVLGRKGNLPCWTSRHGSWGRMDRTVCLPDPTMPEGSLLQDLYDGRLLPLLPLVEFLRHTGCRARHERTTLRATFIVDDPNLHFGSYGHLKYRDVVDHARSNGYHVSFGTVPLDLWYASKSSIRLFQRAGDAVSLAMHGNNHTHEELGHLVGEELILRNGAQALRRVAAFERRYNLPVARVMVPPHGASSEVLLRVFQRLDFDAFAISLPFPWLFGLTLPREHNPERPETRWLPADIVAGGMPIIHRSGEPREYLWLAYVGVPLMKYYHHGNFARGLDRFAEDARFIGQFGDVRWMSLQDIALSNYTLSTHGGESVLSLFSRRVRIARTACDSHIRLAFAPVHGEAGKETVLINGKEVGTLDNGSIQLDLERYDPLPDTLEIRVRRSDWVAAHTVPRPPLMLYPYVRRFLTEGRDTVKSRLRRH